MNERLREELLAMAELDQRIRHEVIAAEASNGSIPDDLVAQWNAIDAANTTRLTEIVAEHGWPGHALVGEAGSESAWLTAQHADAQPQQQEKFLELLRAAVGAGDASRLDLAYLTDRVAMHRGEPQTYGTQQIRQPDGSYQRYQTIEPEHLAVRRAQAGFPAIEHRE